MVEFQRVGDQELNHLEFLSMDLQWDVLIPLVSITRWRTLIINRFEFQENSENYLTDCEKQTASQLKAIFMQYDV